MKENEVCEDAMKTVEEALRVKVGIARTKIGVQLNELEALQDEVLHCKYENDLI